MTDELVEQVARAICGGEPRRIYPEWMQPPYSALDTRLAETLGRIADRTDDWQALEAEKLAALEWCRSHGNPHIPATLTRKDTPMTDPTNPHVRLLAKMACVRPAVFAKAVDRWPNGGTARNLAILRTAVPAEAINLEVLNHDQV